MTGFPGDGETPMELQMFDTATGFVRSRQPRGPPIAQLRARAA